MTDEEYHPHFPDKQPTIKHVKPLARKRRRLWEANPHCHYCGRLLGWHESTLDHVCPKSKGGGNNYNNLVLACQGCNSAKANKLYTGGCLEIKPKWKRWPD